MGAPARTEVALNGSAQEEFGGECDPYRKLAGKLFDVHYVKAAGETLSIFSRADETVGSTVWVKRGRV